MNTKTWACIGMLIAPFANAENIYDGYESYYASLSGSVFSNESKRELQLFSTLPGGRMAYSWEGKVAGIKHSVLIDNGTILVDRHSLKMRSAKAFPGETLNAGDLDGGTEVYFSNAYTCLEDIPSSASGSAVRHKSVYLINTKIKPLLFVKLPSLFGSCLGIRINKNGKIAFDKVSYRYAANEDSPNGVMLTEYSLEDRRFSLTNLSIKTKFVEPDNVYKFSIDPSVNLFNSEATHDALPVQ